MTTGASVPEIRIESADGPHRRIPLARERMTIGRSRESDIFLPDQWLSRHHAEIRREGDAYVLKDLGSKNGTMLNGESIADERRLRHADVISLGEHRLVFRVDEMARAEEEAPAPEGTRVFSARELSDSVLRLDEGAEAAARQNRLLRMQAAALNAFLSHRPLHELFETILDLLLEHVPAERAAILLVDTQAGTLTGGPAFPGLTIKASRSRQGEPIRTVSRSIARKVLTERVSLLVPNLMEDAAFAAQVSILATGIRSAICAPLFLTSPGEADAVIGLVYLDTRDRSRTFTEDDLTVATTLAAVAAAKIENARLLEESLEKQRLDEDLRRAAEIQRGLLPSACPPVENYDLAGSNRPCRAVGGDYYDFGSDGGDVLFVLGDVAGKGTGAALLMAVLRALVRAHWYGADPAEAMVRINRTVCQNVPQGKYITFFLGRLDPPTGRVTYVNAGHNPPLLVRADGSVEMLTHGGVVLGLLPDATYDQGTATLRPGDTLLVFSDGVTETWNLEDEEYGEDRLIALARDGRALGAESLQAEILRQLDIYSAGTKATDDRTLVVLKRA